jgi:hypothetical protein
MEFSPCSWLMCSSPLLRASAAITDPGDGPTPSCVEWRQYTLGDFSLQLRVVSLSCRRNSQNGHAVVSLEKGRSRKYPYSPTYLPTPKCEPRLVKTPWVSILFPPSPKEKRWCVCVIVMVNGKRIPLRTSRCS